MASLEPRPSSETTAKQSKGQEPPTSSRHFHGTTPPFPIKEVETSKPVPGKWEVRMSYFGAIVLMSVLFSIPAQLDLLRRLPGRLTSDNLIMGTQTDLCKLFASF